MFVSKIVCVFFRVGLFSRSASFYFIYEYYSLPNIVLYAFISPVDSKDFIIIIQCFELMQTDHMNTHTHTQNFLLHSHKCRI